MDLQTFLNNAVTAARAETLAKSDQLTLGEMILKMEPIAAKQKDRENEAEVVFDFGSTFPTGLDSWRGAYDELALCWDGGHYGSKHELMTASRFLTMLKDAVGKEFTGWKGGEFTMSKHTPVWVSNSGMGSNSAVIEIVDNGWQIIIMTGYREY